MGSRTTLWAWALPGIQASDSPPTGQKPCPRLAGRTQRTQFLHFFPLLCFCWSRSNTGQGGGGHRTGRRARVGSCRADAAGRTPGSRGPTNHRGPTRGIAGCLGPSFRGLRGRARPSPGGDKDRRGRRQALPGFQEAQGARSARAHQGGRRVLARLSCSCRSGLALRAGLGRLGVPGGRGSLWGPAHGEPRGGHGSRPLPRDGPHPHGIHVPTEPAEPGDTHPEALQVSAEPGALHVDEGLRERAHRHVVGSPGPPSRPSPSRGQGVGARPGLILPTSPAHAAHSREDE